MARNDAIQEQLVQARRNQILDAAAEVFAAKGFHGATVRDVAKAAGVADGTIYNYFENKTALLMGILSMLNQSSEREFHFSQVAGNDPYEWGRAYVRERFKWLHEEGHDVFRALLPELLTNRELCEIYMQQIVLPTYEIGERFFKEWVAQGLVRELDPALTLRTISAMFLGMLMLRLMGDPTVEDRWDEIPDIMAEIMLSGIAKK